MKKQKHNVHGEATASAPRGMVFFDEYHTTKQEACDLICAELGI